MIIDQKKKKTLQPKVGHLFQWTECIIYAITRCNLNEGERDHDQVSRIVTTTTTSSSFHPNRNGTTTTTTTTTTSTIQESTNLKIYVRSKRFVVNKMPRLSGSQLRNNTKQSADSKEATKNISLVLAALLDNYDYNQRPSYGGPPAVITTNLEIRSMGPISELDMEYSLDCYFRQKWQDERLRFTGSANFLSLNIKMLDKIWKPDTYFHTGKGSHLHMITTPNKFLRIYKNGFILYSMRLTIKSLCPMDLHSFPMDKQSCPLILGSYGYPNDQLLYNWDENPVTFNKKDFTLSQFDIVKTISRNGTFSFKRGNHSMLQVNFNLRRHVGYFLIQIYVPCSLIVVLSWVSFWINREATADRVGLGVTSVLTLSTFGLDSRSDLPRVSYATALDWYTIMCFLFVVFTLLEFAGVHYFTKVGTGEVPFFEIEEDLSPNSSEDESILPLSLQKNKWKGAVRQLKRNSLKRSVKNRNYYTRNSKLYGRCSPLPTEFEMKSSNYIKDDFARGDNYRTKSIDFHMPHCPKNLDRQQYVRSRNGSKVNRNNSNNENMSFLENYINKRLSQGSNLVYPNETFISSMDYVHSDSNSLKQTSSWPTLVWSEYNTNTNNNNNDNNNNNNRPSLPWSMTDLSGPPSSDENKNMDFVDELENNSNKTKNVFKWFIYSFSFCCIQFWYCFTSNEKYKQEMRRRRPPGQGLPAVNSVSKIDKVSRIMFPFIFCILNVFYWSFYINERNAEFNQWE